VIDFHITVKPNLQSPGAKSDAPTPCITFHDTQDKGRRFLGPNHPELTRTREA